MYFYTKIQSEKRQNCPVTSMEKFDIPQAAYYTRREAGRKNLVDERIRQATV